MEEVKQKTKFFDAFNTNTDSFWDLPSKEYEASKKVRINIITKN